MLRKSIRVFVQNRFPFSRVKPNTKPTFSEREAGDTDKSVMNDLFDSEGQSDSFIQKNQQIREDKLNGKDTESEKVEQKVRSLLGNNFERYAQTMYKIQGKDSKRQFEPYTEYVPATKYNKEYTINTRVFEDESQLRKMRMIESQGWQGVKDVYPQAASYPVNDVKSAYKTDDLVGELQENELALFNIPLDVDVNEVRKFLESHQLNPLQIDIKTCKLNLNSYAVVSFNNKNEAKNTLSNTRFNGCLLDVLGKEDSQNENAWDRTLAVFNLNTNWTHQEIVHWLSQFGRVHNCLIPLMQLNPDLPTEDELIQALENDNSLLYPAKITVYDVETNKVEKRFWPSETDFLETIKRQKQAFETLSEHQVELMKREIEQRLLFLKSEREYHCLRVPVHLKDEFIKLWVPLENQDKNYLDQQLQNFFLKDYANLGYALVTYPTKLLAQRALFNITSRNSKDLAHLELPIHNQPEFTNLRPQPHTNENHYGHQFRITESLLDLNDQPNAMKTWDGMELYHIDSQYMIHQLENFRKQVAEQVQNIRENVNKENQLQSEDSFKEKQNELRQRIFKELSEPNNASDFDQLISSKSFSQNQDFEETYVKKLGQKPGRKFIASISEQEYKEQVLDLISLANKNQSQQEEFVQNVLDKNQKENIIAIKEEKQAHVLQTSSDSVIKEYQKRLTGKYTEQRKEFKEFSENFDENINSAKQMVEDEENRTEGSEKRTLDGKARKVLIEEKKKAKLTQKPTEGFSSTNKEIAQFEHKVQQDLKQEAFLQELKRMMFGTYTKKEKEELFSKNDNNYDLLQYAQEYSTDSTGREYLDQNIIEKVREFDLPQEENERLKIRKQEFNRKYLVSQIPPDTLLNLKKNVKDNFTSSFLHEYESGTPTESFEIEQGQDGNALAKELNQFVAGRGEKYNYEVDPQTKKEYLVKSEKPFYKYDLEVISQFEGKDEIAEIVEMVMEKYQLPKHQAEKIVQDSMETGQIHPYIQTLYEEALEDMKSDDLDVEKTLKEYGMTKKELDLHLTTNIFKENDLFEQEIEEQIMMEQLLLQNRVNKETVIRTESPQLKMKTPKGKYKVPKFKQF